ncbi:ribosome-associated translation inhibitor RaiA [Leucobacter insecticola]|uniref:Ribosome hibernation promoting factor n=1 Tax=Leucobacter insecticola TaxID=2714934 RepID=A0A6G8FHY9_9MICO|nr:ribosome-associated translation inhibitor RaiA [Leucobacter insecticola]QIM15899.1 ribosome-associated translation inhibitor RaiA [Leucobacter insecticola]
MDVNIRGKNVGITDRFKDYVETKAEKVEGLLPKAQFFEISVSRQSDRSPQFGDRVEITLVGPGPVIRAESTGGDKYTAFDMAYGRVLERIRRMKDKKQEHRGRGRTSLADAAAHDFDMVAVKPAPLEVVESVATGGIQIEGQEAGEEQYSPVVIRTKEFPAEKLSTEEAVDQMELVGHDFFLFVESETGRPSVVYRRKGWNYGVISLTGE